MKGVKTRVVEKTITFDDFMQYLRQRLIKRREQRIIRSRLHQAYTEKQITIALSPHDDKRYLPPDTTDTLTSGHYKIPSANHDGTPPTPESMIE